MQRISRWIPAIPKRNAVWHDRDRELHILMTWFDMKPQRPIALTGPKGCGKTSLVIEACARRGRPLVRINGHRDMTAQDMIGSWIIQQDKSMAWLDGPVPAAMRNGAILLIDEFDRIPSGSLSVLQAVLEGAPLTIPETGDVLEPSPSFAVAACCNSVGDTTGGYSAAFSVDEATLDRFEIVLRIGLPEPEEIREIVASHVPGLPNETYDKLTVFHSALVAAAQEEALREIPSLRRIIALARLLAAGVDIPDAVQASYSDRLHPTEAAAVASHADRVFGGIFDIKKK